MTQADAKKEARVAILMSISSSIENLEGEDGAFDHGANQEKVVAAAKKEGNRVAKMFGYNNWF